MSTAPSSVGAVPGAVRPPRVFISYAIESAEHVSLVGTLWRFLRSWGIDAQIDQAAAQERQDWALWMGDQIRDADHVLVIASPAYKRRAEGRSDSDDGRGVQYEARLIRDAFYRDQHNLNRFLPVVLPGQSDDGVPDFLAPATATVYYVSEFTVAGAGPLLRLLLGRPTKPGQPPPNRIVPSMPPADGPTWLTDRLDRLDIVLDELASTEAAVRKAYPKVSARVRDTLSPTNAVDALRLEAEPLRAAGRSSPDGPRLRTAVSTLERMERAAARALQRAQDRQCHYAAGLDHWARLTGMLDAYRAEATDRGLAEDLELGGLYRSALSMFRSGPCDLDAAEDAVTRYTAAVRRRRDRPASEEPRR